MGRYKQEILDQLEQAEIDYAECKIDKKEFLAKITACGVSLQQDKQEHMENAEEER